MRPADGLYATTVWLLLLPLYSSQPPQPPRHSTTCACRVVISMKLVPGLSSQSPGLHRRAGDHSTVRYTKNSYRQAGRRTQQGQSSCMDPRRTQAPPPAHLRSLRLCCRTKKQWTLSPSILRNQLQCKTSQQLMYWQGSQTLGYTTLAILEREATI